MHRRSCRRCTGIFTINAIAIVTLVTHHQDGVVALSLTATSIAIVIVILSRRAIAIAIVVIAHRAVAIIVNFVARRAIAIIVVTC